MKPLPSSWTRSSLLVIFTGLSVLPLSPISMLRKQMYLSIALSLFLWFPADSSLPFKKKQLSKLGSIAFSRPVLDSFTSKALWLGGSTGQTMQGLTNNSSNLGLCSEYHRKSLKDFKQGNGMIKSEF